MVKNRRGSQAVEFALIMPVMMALMSGIVDFGWYFRQQAVVNTIVRDAARRGSVTTVVLSRGVAESAACSQLQLAGLSSGGATCAEVSSAVSGAAPNASLRLTATVPFPRLFGLVPMPTNVSSSLVLRIEGD